MKKRVRLLIYAVLVAVVIGLLSRPLRKLVAPSPSPPEQRPDRNDDSPVVIGDVSSDLEKLPSSASRSSGQPSLPSKHLDSLDFPYSKSWTPKITIIVIWHVREAQHPIYLPYFLQSVKANPQITLLFVQVDKLDIGCSDFSTVPNVHSVCLKEEQYLQLHVDFLCEKWHCSEEEKTIFYEHLFAKKELDINNSFFRVLRNGIFRSWMDPATTIWGWCDADTFWGNFSRAFPWDIAHDFDILAPGNQPDREKQELLFTRGHMAFFRNSPNVLRHFLAYPRFASLSEYLALPPTLTDAEESEFSHYIFSDERAFTFVVFEGKVHNWDTVLVSHSGVFYASMLRREDFARLEPRQREQKRLSLLAIIMHHTNRSQIVPTFSIADDHHHREGDSPGSNPDFLKTAGPTEYPARVFTSGDSYTGSLWFHPRYATVVETDWPPWPPPPPSQGAPSSAHRIRVAYPPKSYFLRRTPNAPITQRVEPRERYLLRDAGDEDGALAIDECLYLHWQEEKRQPWFRRIPKDGIKFGQTYVQFNNDEVEIWDEMGRVVHSTKKP